MQVFMGQYDFVDPMLFQRPRFHSGGKIQFIFMVVIDWSVLVPSIFSILFSLSVRKE